MKKYETPSKVRNQGVGNNSRSSQVTAKKNSREVPKIPTENIKYDQNLKNIA